METLLGDASKARKILGWEPTSSLEELVSEMLDNDLKEARKVAKLKLVLQGTLKNVSLFVFKVLLHFLYALFSARLVWR